MNAVVRFEKVSAVEGENHEAVIDHRTALMWSANDLTVRAVSHAKAEKAASECRVLGHADWRLPTEEELLTLVDRARYSPAIDTDAFPSCKSDWYWSSTPAAWSPESGAWFVGFDYGSAGTDDRANGNRVRAVRSVAAAASQSSAVGPSAS